MTESMIVEAVRAVGGVQSTAVAMDPDAANAVSMVANPESVARFEAAMGVDGPESVQAIDPIPFASEASAVWRSAQVKNQEMLHRVRALSELDKSSGTTAGNLLELQYEVANLAFQQEVVTKVADKSSNAIQTLIKNQ